jgi:hypothetical protein
MVSQKYSIQNLNGNLHEFRTRLSNDKTGFFQMLREYPYLDLNHASEIYLAGDTLVIIDYEFGEDNKTRVSAEIAADTPVGVSYTRKKLTDLLRVLEGLELEEVKK